MRDYLQLVIEKMEIFGNVIINYKSYYSHYNILLNDFYYIYNTFFEKEILLSVIVTIVITLYSFFFIPKNLV